jgi:hypothetical protein
LLRRPPSTITRKEPGRGVDDIEFDEIPARSGTMFIWLGFIPLWTNVGAQDGELTIVEKARRRV